jgi:P2-related tail formation protein
MGVSKMSKPSDILQPSLRPDTNILNLVKALDDPWSDLCSQVIFVLIYPRIDSLNEDVVDLLAHQFHLESYRLATNLLEKRAMVKNSIELHRKKGTPWAVKQSLVSAGYRDAIIQEAQRADGTYIADGSIFADSPGDFEFRVLLDLGNYRGIDAALVADIIQCINDYKNARSHLIGLRWKTTISDAVSITDLPMPIVITFSHRANGTYYANGSIDASGQHQTSEVMN